MFLLSWHQRTEINTLFEIIARENSFLVSILSNHRISNLLVGTYKRARLDTLVLIERERKHPDLQLCYELWECFSVKLRLKYSCHYKSVVIREFVHVLIKLLACTQNSQKKVEKVQYFVCIDHFLCYLLGNDFTSLGLWQGSWGCSEIPNKK